MIYHADESLYSNFIALIGAKLLMATYAAIPPYMGVNKLPSLHFTLSL